MKQLPIGFTAIVILLMSGISGIGDSAPPYGFDCLKGVDLWEQVQGNWGITNGVMRHEPAGFDKIAILATNSVHVPSWYDVTVRAGGLSNAQERTVAIVFGYQSKDDYWVCLFEGGDRQATVGLRHMLKGLATMAADVPVVRELSDTITLQLQLMHSEDTYMTVMVEHHLVLKFRIPVALPRRLGIMAHSSNVHIDGYKISGIAKR